MWTTKVEDSSKANPPGMGIEFQYSSQDERTETEKIVERLLTAELGEHLAGKLLTKG